MDFVSVLRGIIGMGVLIGIAYLFSNNKKKINWRLVGSGLGIQFVFAIFILKGAELGNLFSPLGWPKQFFKFISSFFVLVLNFTTESVKALRWQSATKSSQRLRQPAKSLACRAGGRGATRPRRARSLSLSL